MVNRMTKCELCGKDIPLLGSFRVGPYNDLCSECATKEKELKRDSETIESNQIRRDPSNTFNRIQCPSCEMTLSPQKSPSMLGMILISGLYMAYYYIIKGRHCANCGFEYSNNQLKTLGYQDPDSTYRILVILLVILQLWGLWAIIGGLASYGYYY